MSFSTWKDSSKLSASYSLDPSQGGSSPIRRIAGAGAIEDWGIAFEGLPLDSRLYPAVGLYQRDDRVTLLNVESGGRLSSREGVGGNLAGGIGYYPSIPESISDRTPEMSHAAQVKRHNDLLSWDGILHVTETLRSLSGSLHSGDGQETSLLCSVIPSLSAALSLAPPSIPVLSQRFGVLVLPQISRCIQELNSLVKAQQKLFSCGIQQGRWVIRATGSTGSGDSVESEEYVIGFENVNEDGDLTGDSVGFHGKGVGTTGKSKNGLVSIIGTVCGSRLHFVEEWADGAGEETPSETAASSCVVSARMSLDGCRFEGTYRNVQYGTCGQIAGMLISPDVSEKEDERNDLPGVSLKCEALLCLAHGHVASILAEDLAGDHACNVDLYRPEHFSSEQWENHCLSLKEWISSPLLANGLVGHGYQDLLHSLDDLRQLYASPLSNESLTSNVNYDMLGPDCLLEATGSTDQTCSSDLKGLIAKVDDLLATRSGGKGSLAALCPQQYSETRMNMICALAYHEDARESIVQLGKTLTSVEAVSDDLIRLWRVSLRIMEDSVRRVLSSTDDPMISRKDATLKACQNIDRVSNFLMKVALNPEPSGRNENLRTDRIASFYAAVGSEEDLGYLEAEMECSTKRALLRMCAMKDAALVLKSIMDTEAIVAIDCLACMIPRLMGRTWAKVDRSREGRADANDLGGYYLAQLSGAATLPTNALRASVFAIYGALDHMLDLYSDSKETQWLSRNSLLLSILSSYIVCIRDVDVPAIISGSSLFQRLSVIIEARRGSVHETQRNLVFASDEMAAILEIRDICNRDASRAVLRSAISIVHVMAFQSSQFGAQAQPTGINCPVDILRDCLKLLVDELRLLVPLIEASMQEKLTEVSQLQASGDWEKWCGACLPGGFCSSTSQTDTSTKMVCEAGIAYLHEHGVGLPLIGTQSGTQKVSPRTDSPGSSKKTAPKPSTDVGARTLYCQRHLTQWLHVFACVCKSQSSLQMLADDFGSTDVLLSAIGLSCDRNSEGTITLACVNSEDKPTLLPARHRARILRLMRGLMVLTSPNELLVEGLLALVGLSMTVESKGNDAEDCFVTREAVSLLRYLHLPAFPQWRECVLRVISQQIELQEKGNPSAEMSLGLVLFLGGSINALGRGAFVLLKPPAAVSVSSEAHASPSNKSFGSSGGSGSPSGVGISPHHIAGNGTEGIVSGLCRAEATAGIVSSVLTKNGMCEVILVNRQRLPSSRDNSLPSRDDAIPSLLSEKEPSSSRHALTVRAVRSPLSNLALAEEIPLFLDPSTNMEQLLGRTLLASLESFKVGGSNTASNNADRPESSPDGAAKCDSLLNMQNPITSLATLKSVIALTSNKEVLQKFLKTEMSAESFARVLDHACNGNAIQDIKAQAQERTHFESLCDLPRHEAQYSHLTALLREVNVRREVLRNTPMSFWEQKLSEQRKLREESSPDRAGAIARTEESEGDRSPTVVASATDASPSSVTGVTRAAVDDEGRREESARMVSQSTVSTNNSTDEDEDEAASAAAAHLREAAIAQMAELGLPRSWSELALRRTGGTNIEAAVHFCLERGGDMERLIAEDLERERMMQQQSSGGSTSRRRSSRMENTNHLLEQLLEMGFPRRWCAEALAATGNNVDEALTWILTNGERLSAEDVGMEEMESVNDVDDEDSAEDEEDEEQPLVGETEAVEASSDTGQGMASANSPSADVSSLKAAPAVDSASGKSDTAEGIGWSGPVCPLRFISGRSIINSKTLSVSGLPTGGFSSVGTKGILLTSGKWYYEAILETAGCLQIGWADGSFSGHCNADRGDGCGDGPSSWAFDGWRRYRWHASATEWGCRWKEGDVVGCLVDLDNRIVSFMLNGQAEEIGMGVAFSEEGFRPCGGVYACVSFNRREKLRLILGGECSEPFKYQPPEGYKGVGEAVLHAVGERDKLLMKENIMDLSTDNVAPKPKRFLCDFSEGEHGHELFAWQHRYYGSDASVHLGSARPSKLGSESQKSGSGSSSEMSAVLSISRRVEKEWKSGGEISGVESTKLGTDSDVSEIVSRVTDGYDRVIEKLNTELRAESAALGILYCRKLILHLMVTLGKDFDLRYFISSGSGNEGDRELTAARHLWFVLDTCVSLRSVGWVGEAGAMAVAAESLGLGISTAPSRHGISDARAGGIPSGQSDEFVSIPAAGISQVLSTVLLSGSAVSGEIATSSSIAAGAEGAIGSGGALVFLRPSLQSVVSTSSIFQDLLVAVVRRSVRLLAAVDYSGEDSSEESSEVRECDFLSPLTGILKNSW